ncbi:MAG: HEPN domain-containing protein [Phycisphaerae bacterium]|nr:HEPN domain-containing protein [Phycisphaerae bacterium]
MSDHEHSVMVLAMARKDLKALSAMLDAGTFDDEIFGFHAQQTAEKALKAWLSLVGVEYPKVHDLDELMATLADHGVPVPEQFSELAELTDFAVQFRYEAFESLGEEMDRSKVLKQLTDLVAYVTEVLARSRPSDAR